jgi:hypothetical protein
MTAPTPSADVSSLIERAVANAIIAEMMAQNREGDEPLDPLKVARAAIAACDTETAIVLKRYREALEAIRNACNYGVNSPDEALNYVDDVASAALKASASPC